MNVISLTKIRRTIVDEDERLVGIITNRDLQFERNLDRPLREAMTSEGLVTAREGTTLDEAEQILGKNRIEKLPVVDERGVATDPSMGVMHAVRAEQHFPQSIAAAIWT